jgi:hypothetical protein
LLVDRLSFSFLLLDVIFLEPSLSRFRFVSIFSVVLSLVEFLSESRDRLFCFELFFSLSLNFFSDICRVIFFSIDGDGLESSSRITQIGDGG